MTSYKAYNKVFVKCHTFTENEKSGVSELLHIDYPISSFDVSCMFFGLNGRHPTESKELFCQVISSVRRWIKWILINLIIQYDDASKVKSIFVTVNG
jgi:hypothetical protein